MNNDSHEIGDIITSAQKVFLCCDHLPLQWNFLVLGDIQWELQLPQEDRDKDVVVKLLSRTNFNKNLEITTSA